LIGLVAGVLYVRRANGIRFLAIGVASGIFLLVFTFMFLLFWLRGILDLGLLVALLWSARKSQSCSTCLLDQFQTPPPAGEFYLSIR